MRNGSTSRDGEACGFQEKGGTASASSSLQCDAAAAADSRARFITVRMRILSPSCFQNASSGTTMVARAAGSARMSLRCVNMSSTSRAQTSFA